MAELTDQEMNDHMDEYEDQVSVFSQRQRGVTRITSRTMERFNLTLLYVDVLLVTPCSLHSFTRVTGTGYPLRFNSTS